MKNMTREQRLLFLNISIISSIGIWLSGYDQVHWLAYVVPGALIFAALSGYCVGLDIAKVVVTLFGKSANKSCKV